MISFIYFDVGGVIINDLTGMDKWIKMKRSMGIGPGYDKEFETEFALYEQKMCRGELDLDSLKTDIESKFHIRFPENYSLLDDLVNRCEQNTSIWPLLENVRQRFRTGLLTNMYLGMFDKLVQRHLLPTTDWEVIIDSSVVKHAKPEKEIFAIAQERANVPKENILFIDNMKQNIEGANAAGWQTYWYDARDYQKSSGLLEEYLHKLIAI